ncbi:MAG: nucleotidyltransferase domain-containing protein [Bacteroidota bacterium]
METTEVELIIRQIVDKLRHEYHPIKVMLFGSYANGHPNNDSDIDLLIIKETNERFIDRWVAIRKILSDPSRMVPIETLVLTPKEIADRLECGDQFISEIINNGRIVYGA